jgi:hypothetical protein
MLTRGGGRLIYIAMLVMPYSSAMPRFGKDRAHSFNRETRTVLIILLNSLIASDSVTGGASWRRSRQTFANPPSPLFPYFLGAFVKFRMATISFVKSASLSHPSVRPHAKTRLPLDGFSSNLIFEGFFFRKSVEKIQVLLTLDNCTGYST